MIAKSMGAEVTVVYSKIKKELLNDIDADHFIDCELEVYADTGSSYNVIFY